MRSHLFSWKLVTVLLLAIVAGCQHLSSRAERATSSPHTSPEPLVHHRPSTTWPGLNTLSSSTAGDRALSNPSTEAESLAVITAQDSDAWVNVRSTPSQQSNPVGQGQVGDQVIVQEAAVADDGFTWYSVTFRQSAIAGWVRGDFLSRLTPSEETPPSSDATGIDPLKVALDEQCGGPRAIQSYFVTRNHIVYLCKVRGRWVYLSQEKGTTQVITAEDVEVAGGGYIITNGNYEYRLDASAFVVVRIDDAGDRHEVLIEPVTYTEKY